MYICFSIDTAYTPDTLYTHVGYNKSSAWQYFGAVFVFVWGFITFPVRVRDTDLSAFCPLCLVEQDYENVLFDADLKQLENTL